VSSAKSGSMMLRLIEKEIKDIQLEMQDIDKRYLDRQKRLRKLRKARSMIIEVEGEKNENSVEQQMSHEGFSLSSL
jgi:hypothetical protein